MKFERDFVPYNGTVGDIKELNSMDRHRIDHELIWNLYKTKYYGCTILFLCEKLEEDVYIITEKNP